jgi:hypothetical protein
VNIRVCITSVIELAKENKPAPAHLDPDPAPAPERYNNRCFILAHLRQNINEALDDLTRANVMGLVTSVMKECLL